MASPLAANAIDHIEDIPGLYISDITVPRDPELLRKHGITHVLSLTDGDKGPEIEIAPGSIIEHISVQIGDNPLEDLLPCLEALCAWIGHALARPRPPSTLASDLLTAQPRVLVHCAQGISRSGAVVTAYAMRALALDYEAALARVRARRPAVAPNPGFADQLRLWRELGHSVYDAAPTPGPTHTGEEGQVVLKPRYEAWRAGRGV